MYTYIKWKSHHNQRYAVGEKFSGMKTTNHQIKNHSKSQWDNKNKDRPGKTIIKQENKIKI